MKKFIIYSLLLLFGNFGSINAFSCFHFNALSVPFEKLNTTWYIQDVANKLPEYDYSCGYGRYFLNSDGLTGNEVRTLFNNKLKVMESSTYSVKQVQPGIVEKTGDAGKVSTATLLAFEEGKYDIFYVCERSNGMDLEDRFSLASIGLEMSAEDIQRAYELIGGIPADFIHHKISGTNCSYI